MAASPSPKSLAIVFLICQSVLTTVWWVGMSTVPQWRPLFFPMPHQDVGWSSYIFPDAVFYIAAGAIAAFGFLRGRRYAWPLLLVHAGAVGFAALHALAQAFITGRAWFGGLSMLASFVVVAWLAWRLQPE